MTSSSEFPCDARKLLFPEFLKSPNLASGVFPSGGRPAEFDRLLLLSPHFLALSRFLVGAGNAQVSGQTIF